MRTFLFKVILFTTLLLLLNMGFQWVLKEYYWGDYRKVDLAYRKFILADSHGLPMGDHPQAHGVFNFSAGSDSYHDMLLKTKYLIAHGRVDTLLITVDGHTLSSYRNEMNNVDRSVYFSGPADHPSYYAYLKDRHIRTSLSWFDPKARSILARFIRAQAEGLVALTQEQAPGQAAENWADINATARDRRVAQRMKTQYTEGDRAGSLVEALQEIIDLCEARGTVLIGVKFPLTLEYGDAVRSRALHADSILWARGLRVVDLSEAYAHRPELFANQDHLNEAGGALLTRDLVRAIRKAPTKFGLRDDQEQEPGPPSDQR